MIEREFVSEKIKQFKIKELINKRIRKFAGVGDIEIEKTPLGEKIIIHAVRPGLIIGSGGESVKELTEILRKDFKLENPQIEIKEIIVPTSFAAVVAKRIASDMERFGSARFKLLGYNALTEIIRNGAMGAEIRITGVGLPGSRAKPWLFSAGLMKKCGDVASKEIDRAIEVANLKKGTVGIKVAIMPGDAELPDKINVHPAPEIVVQELEEKETKPEVEIVAEAKIAKEAGILKEESEEDQPVAEQKKKAILRKKDKTERKSKSKKKEAKKTEKTKPKKTKENPEKSKTKQKEDK